MDEEKKKISTTTNGLPPEPGYENAPAPAPVGANGQHKAYWVLNEEERKNGWVRPLRRAYKHVGPSGPTHPLENMSEEEKTRYADEGWVKFERYPPGSHALGKYWSQADLDAVNNGCQTVTSMGLALCETYAKNPHYYGSTFCSGCSRHLPVFEFRWVEDGELVGS